jgi:hypothetical protein
MNLNKQNRQLQEKIAILTLENAQLTQQLSIYEKALREPETPKKRKR